MGKKNQELRQEDTLEAKLAKFNIFSQEDIDWEFKAGRHQMCQIVDCRYPMAQLLCDGSYGSMRKCSELTLNKECGDSGKMVACYDGSCITSDAVCDGNNTCSNPDDLGFTEDEYGCLNDFFLEMFHLRKNN